MPSYRSQGRERFEAERSDELSDGIPSVAQAEATHERKTGGNRIPKGATAIPSMGGKARKGRTKLTHEIALGPVSDVLRRNARYMRRRTCTELAAMCGDGYCGIVPSLLIKLASEDMALREHALAAGDVDQARRFGESARGHLVYSRELVCKDAETRKKPGANGLLPPGMAWVEEDK